MKEIKKIFDWHTDSCFQGVYRAVSFQTAVISAVAFRSIRVDADVLNQTTVHMISQVDFVSGDDCTTKVWIQQKN